MGLQTVTRSKLLSLSVERQCACFIEYPLNCPRMFNSCSADRAPSGRRVKTRLDIALLVTSFMHLKYPVVKAWSAKNGLS